MERQRHRMPVVVQQQVEHLRQPRRAEITRTVDRRAVADVQQPLHRLGPGRVGAFQLAHQDARHELHAFDAPAQAHHAPALVVHHVFFGESGERGERQQHALVDFAAAAARGHCLLHLALQSDHAAPVTRRQPVAHLRRAPGEMLDVGLQALRIARAQRIEYFRFGGHHAEVAADLPRVRPHARVAARGERSQQQSRGVFAAHRVAAQPEEILDQARRNVVLALQVGPLAGLNRSERFLVRIFAEHPDVLGAAAALRGHHVGGGFVGDARQAAGHHAHAVRASPPRTRGSSARARRARTWPRISTPAPATAARVPARRRRRGDCAGARSAARAPCLRTRARTWARNAGSGR